MKKILFVIGVLFIALAVFAAWFIPAAFIGSPAQNTIKLDIPDGISSGSLADLLQQKGIITSAFGYRIYTRLDKRAANIRAGEYELAPGSSFRSLSGQLSLGPPRNEISIRLIEGSSLLDIAKALIDNGVSATSVSDLIGSRSEAKFFQPALRDQFPFLKDLPADATLEGYLFPNTYRVWKDQLPLSLILKQLQEFSVQTQGFAEQAAKQGRTLQDVVTLASIVEKEANTPEERRVIAGIFLNRIKIGMRLQSDATINYITGADRARPTAADLQADSPYNTYRNDGLPPGPICNPGKDSLDAALHPTASDYYFYLHDANGKVYYARNIEEHKLNRYKAYGE